MIRGFTLIELLIVIAIVGILVGAMVPMFRVTQLTAQHAKVQAELDTIKTAAIMFHQDTGAWPRKTFGMASIDLVTGAVIAPGSGANWRGPYLDAWRRDPWGMSYSIYNVGSARWVESWGPDATNGGTDDIGLMITPNYAF